MCLARDKEVVASNLRVADCIFAAERQRAAWQRGCNPIAKPALADFTGAESGSL